MELDALLIAGVERGASDVHLKPEVPPILRINGRLEPQADLGVVTAEFMEDLVRRILPERLHAQLKDGREVDVRGAALDACDQERVEFHSMPT